MGTRGIWGFVIDGEIKATYNHWDSYPSGLGTLVLRTFRTAVASDEAWDDLLTKVRALKLVTEDTKPTSEEIERLKQYHESGVSTGQPTEWYSLLRKTQFDVEATLESGYMIDSIEFARDSLFCEWGYLIDLDRAVLEVYEGFQKSQPAGGRFRDWDREPDNDYYPIALKQVFLSEDINTWSDEDFASQLERQAADEAS